MLDPKLLLKQIIWLSGGYCERGSILLDDLEKSWREFFILERPFEKSVSDLVLELVDEKEIELCSYDNSIEKLVFQLTDAYMELENTLQDLELVSYFIRNSCDLNLLRNLLSWLVEDSSYHWTKKFQELEEQDLQIKSALDLVVEQVVLNYDKLRYASTTIHEVNEKFLLFITRFDDLAKLQMISSDFIHAITINEEFVKVIRDVLFRTESSIYLEDMVGQINFQEVLCRIAPSLKSQELRSKALKTLDSVDSPDSIYRYTVIWNSVLDYPVLKEIIETKIQEIAVRIQSDIHNEDRLFYSCIAYLLRVSEYFNWKNELKESIDFLDRWMKATYKTKECPECNKLTYSYNLGSFSCSECGFYMGYKKISLK